MIRTYYLLVETIDGTEQVVGSYLIHDALLQTTSEPTLRKLIMDTSPEEHDQLAALAENWNEATPEEIDQYNAQVVITPPDPDTIRAEEILATSPDVITMPEMWDLLRIFGRRMGYRSD